MNVTTPIAGKMTFNRKKVTLFFLDHIIEMVLLLLIIGLTLGAKNFMTWSNWMNILRSNSLRGVIALGMTMVIISGQIDLSIGSTVALSGVIVAYSCRELPKLGMSLDLACIVGIGIALLAAVLIGTFHGVFQYKAGMPAFIVTLVSKNGLYGLAAIISGGYPIANAYPDWFNFLGGGRIPLPGGLEGIPVAALVLIISFVIVFFIMNYTTTGRATYAVGGNPESARLSGINVGKTLIICFVAVQILAVISGFMTSGQVLAGSYSFGFGWELDVISAVIIGGTSFSGGLGTVWGTLLGIIFMGVITNGMTLLNYDIYLQYVVKAGIMFFAVLISSYRAKAKA
jgi:ribose/xylose/arabinose/galactoside ABC-type transport system permease subunit